jgi:hypothetical protein
MEIFGKVKLMVESRVRWSIPKFAVMEKGLFGNRCDSETLELLVFSAFTDE